MRKTITTLLSTAALLLGTAASATTLGALSADAYGYSGQTTAFNLRDVRSTGAITGNAANCDDCVSGAVNLGFSFNFYGTNYSQVYVSSNGFIGFNSTVSQGCCEARPMPQNDEVNNAIAAGWTDLLPRNGGTVRTQTLGSAGSREFVVGWYGVPLYYNTSVFNTFEIILHEGSNDIEFQWANLTADNRLTGAGIENAAGDTGLQVALDSRLSLQNQGYLVGSNLRNDVPEPGALALVGLALAGLAMTRRRNRG